MGPTDLVSAWADPAQVEAIARKTLDQEDGDLPPFYILILTRYLKLHPYDANFIIELAEKGKAWTGGNGFGTVTCMDCWKVSPLVPPALGPPHLVLRRRSEHRYREADMAGYHS